jgi:hypothetical protein
LYYTIPIDEPLGPPRRIPPHPWHPASFSALPKKKNPSKNSKSQRLVYLLCQGAVGSTFFSLEWVPPLVLPQELQDFLLLFGVDGKKRKDLQRFYTHGHGVWAWMH